MADWTNLPNLAVGVGGLPSGTTVTALRDNPIAIAEGAAGAPRVEGLGQSVTRAATYTAAAQVSEVVFTDLPTWHEIFLAIGSVSFPVTESNNLILDFSTDNGANFSALTIVQGGTVGGVASNRSNLHFGDFVFLEWGILFRNQSLVSNFSSPINAIRFRARSSTSVVDMSNILNLNVYLRKRGVSV